MHKAGVLLGVRGDDMIDSSDTHARARRILTPQREYPIFTPVSSLCHSCSALTPSSECSALSHSSGTEKFSF